MRRRRGVGLIAAHAWLDHSATLPGMYWEIFRVEAEEVLAERLAGCSERYPDVAVERTAVESRPAQQLIAQSGSGSVGGGWQPRACGFAGLLLGSVGSAVAHRARSAVIVARPR